MHSRRDNTRKGPGYAVPVNVEVQPDMPVVENLPNVVGLEQGNCDSLANFSVPPQISSAHSDLGVTVSEL
jgi:hypothetical protein